MKILYFTATGNNLYIAKSIGGELLSIPKMIKEETFEFTDEKIGIVFPIYAIKVPQYVEEFLRKAKFNCDYLFCVMTYGANDGASSTHVMNIANESGYKFDYINTIKMVDNWIPGFKMEKQIASEHKKQIENKLETVKADIESSKKYIQKVSPVDRLMTSVMINDARKNPTKESLYGKVNGNGIKNFVTIEETCISCGVCSRVCPVNNIVVDKEAKTVTFGDYCISCFACTHNCTVNCIRMKGEKSRARFRNKNIKVQEIIKSND